MFTLVAFSESQDSAVLTQVDALADPHVAVISGRVVVPQDLPNIVGLFGLGPNITRAQLISPSLRTLVNPELSPLDVAALPTAPSRFIDYRFTPIQLAPNEQLEADAAESAAGASRSTVLVWLADGPIQPVSGDVRSVRVTSATATVANVWTNVALTLDQSLPAGRYQVVGARFFSTNLQAFRLVFSGYPWRPGGIGVADATIVEPLAQRYGNFGAWGEFAHNVPPTVDMLANGADATQTGVLDLVKVA